MYFQNFYFMVSWIFEYKEGERWEESIEIKTRDKLIRFIIQLALTLPHAS